MRRSVKVNLLQFAQQYLAVFSLALFWRTVFYIGCISCGRDSLRFHFFACTSRACTFRAVFVAPDIFAYANWPYTFEIAVVAVSIL